MFPQVSSHLTWIDRLMNECMSVERVAYMDVPSELGACSTVLIPHSPIVVAATHLLLIATEIPCGGDRASCSKKLEETLSEDEHICMAERDILEW